MKISWSYRIVGLYVSFVVLILSLVTICMKQTVELESKDYYAQELKYQDRIDATNNANALENSITHEVSGKQVFLTMPTEQIGKDFTGEIYFFCPSDGLRDFKIKMQFDSFGKQTVDVSAFQKGAYKMKLSWKSNGKNYYKENVISIK